MIYSQQHEVKITKQKRSKALQQIKRQIDSGATLRGKAEGVSHFCCDFQALRKHSCWLCVSFQLSSVPFLALIVHFTVTITEHCSSHVCVSMYRYILAVICKLQKYNAF